MFRNRYFWLLISLFFVLKTEAKVTLTSIWGDNMVLQQQAEVTFRGKATPGKRVYASASWNHRKIYADCDRNGQWTLALPTPEAGGPYTITFSDGEELTLKNILIGSLVLLRTVEYGNAGKRVPRTTGLWFAALYRVR